MVLWPRPSGNLASLTNGQFVSCLGLYSMHASLLRWCVCAVITFVVTFRPEKSCLELITLKFQQQRVFSWHSFGHHIVMAFFLFFDINSIQPKELLFVFQELLLMDVCAYGHRLMAAAGCIHQFYCWNACRKIEKWSLMGLCICARLT